MGPIELAVILLVFLVLVIGAVAVHAALSLGRIDQAQRDIWRHLEIARARGDGVDVALAVLEAKLRSHVECYVPWWRRRRK